MPRELTPAEIAVFQMDSDYLNADIPVYGSRVAKWGTMTVLIYHTNGFGYTLSDISDLGSSTISELAKQSEIHGMWFYLPTAIQEVIAEDAETVATAAASAGKTLQEITKQVAETTGKTLHDLIAPLVDALSIPLILVGALLGIYLLKKGGI